MRRALALTTLLLPVAAPAAAAPPDRIEPSCPPQGATVLARGSEAILYRPRGVEKRNAHACSRRTGKARDLSHLDGGGDVRRPFRLAGEWVAWVGEGGCDFSFTFVVRVLNVRTGAEYEGAPIPRCGRDLSGPRVPVRELVVTSRGSVAWIQVVDGVREVHKLDSAGGERLASGGSDVRGLRVRGPRLSWRSGGASRDYRLDRRARCGRRGSSTVQRTPDTRAYRHGESVFACLLAVGRHVRLGRMPMDFERSGVNDLTLAGPFAAFDDGFAGRSGSRLEIKVVDLREGRTIREFACCSGVRLSSMHVLALAPTGAVAWTQWSDSDPYGEGDRREVLAWGQTEAPVVLDSISPDLDSLFLDGTTLHWTNAGEPRSAELR